MLSAEAAGVLGVVAGTSSMVTEDWLLALEAAPFGFLPSAGRAVGREVATQSVAGYTPTWATASISLVRPTIFEGVMWLTCRRRCSCWQVGIMKSSGV